MVCNKKRIYIWLVVKGGKGGKNEIFFWDLIYFWNNLNIDLVVSWFLVRFIDSMFIILFINVFIFLFWFLFFYWSSFFEFEIGRCVNINNVVV